MTKLEWALYLAAKGFYVFPAIQIEDGTKLIPWRSGWQDRATNDPEVIKKLWTQQPDNEIGIYPAKFGKGESLIVIDIDDKNGKNGSESWEAVLDLIGDVPPTFTVRTPTGGRHLYFRTNKPVPVTYSLVGRGIDTPILAWAPGSAKAAGVYEMEADSDIALAPEALDKLIRTLKAPAKERKTDFPQHLLDEQRTKDRAEEFLKTTNWEAIEGQYGNNSTYSLACKMANMGLTPETACDLMDEHWNNPPRVSPVWTYEELLGMCHRAFNSNQNGVGSDHPASDFKVEETLSNSLMPELKITPPIGFKALVAFDEKDIEPRHWILGRILLRDKVTIMIAPPGVGKSTATLAWGFAVATGRADLTGMEVFEPGKVLVINNEDDEDELKRRLAAVRRHHNIPWADLENKMFIYSGVERPFIIATRKPHQEGVKRGKDMDDLINYIKENNISFVIADPFLETHEADENDNVQINQVGRFYREVASVTGCAVCLVHHTRKVQGGRSDGHIGNMDSGRGASSLTGVARVVVTLYDMTEKDAVRYNIPEDNRHLYVRLDDAKVNLSLKANNARWFKKEGIRLANEDEVGVLSPVDLKEAVVETQDDIMDALAQWDLFEDFRKRTWLPVKTVARLLKDGNCLSVSEMSVDGLARKLEAMFQGDGLSNDTVQVRHEKHVRDGRNSSVLYCKILDEIDIIPLI